MKDTDHKQCSFCAKEEYEVGFLVTGYDGNICKSCLEQANTIIASRVQEYTNQAVKSIKLLLPSEINFFLDQYVIGQAYAKRVLSVAVYNHYKRLKYNDKEKDSDEVEIDKSNILLIGETGTGKTLLASTISRLLEVPFTIVDATAFTQSGYVGEDIESILSRLLQVCDYDVKRAERGIVFIDEIDKIARKGENVSITRDVSGEGVQQSLLKLLEGTEVLVPPQGGRKHPEQQMVRVNTSNILFICGGAFVGLQDIIRKRLSSKRIGFNLPNDVSTDFSKQHAHLFTHVSANDLKKFGLIPELIGRLPVLCHLDELDRETIKRILVEPKNALIKQYQKLFALDNIEVNFSDDALDFIVDTTLEMKLGARGLRSVCERIFTPIFFAVKKHHKPIKIKLTEAKCKQYYLVA